METSKSSELSTNFAFFPENAMEIIQEIQQTIVIELRLLQ